MVKVLTDPKELPESARPLGLPFYVDADAFDDYESILPDKAVKQAGTMGADLVVLGEVGTYYNEWFFMPAQAYRLHMPNDDEKKP
jgi:hypothetical protein